MLIVNADDWGRDPATTDATLECANGGRVHGASAMVFMVDSQRAAELTAAVQLDCGLHLNFDEPVSSRSLPKQFNEKLCRVSSFLTRSRYARIVFHPLLRNAFDYVFKAQWDEFTRLYGVPPARVDGHHHQHLCANVLLQGLIPEGTRIRRNFTFSAGQKSMANRLYRGFLDRRLTRHYRIVDGLFSVVPMMSGSVDARTGAEERLIESSNAGVVELMVHPGVAVQRSYLLSDAFGDFLNAVETGRFNDLD